MNSIIIVAIIIVILIFVLSFFTSLKKDEVSDMLKLRHIYLYLVSFVSLIMILVGLVYTVQNITDVIFPTNYYYEALPSEKISGLSPEDKTAYEENQRKIELNRQVESKKNVAKSIAVVIVALPTFIYHWRKIEKEKHEAIQQK